MSNKIWSYWYRKADTEHGNFGDELGPYIVRKLSQSDVHHLPFPRSGVLLFLSATRALIMRRLRLGDYMDCIRFILSGDNYILTAGSIIGWGSGPRRMVWGSGIISLQDEIPAAKFLAVRGEETRKLLIEQGHVAPDVVGDPGLLAPLVYKPRVLKKYRLGLVLHYIHTDVINRADLSEDVLVIDLLEDTEAVVDAICSCECILSTSLHGLIVPHAYGISALWLEVSSLPLTGDNIKFKDYFSSVGIQPYQPICIENVNFEMIDEIFSDHLNKCGVQQDLSGVQRDLLRVAPFEVESNLISTLNINECED